MNMPQTNAEILNHAQMLAQDGERDAARQWVRRAIRNDESDVEAWWALAQLATSDAESRRALREVLSLDPQHLHAQHMLDQLNAGSLQLDNDEPINTKPDDTNAKYGIAEKDYMMPALFTLVAYFIFGFFAIALNIYFMWDARKLRAQGYDLRNVGCLYALLMINIGLFVAGGLALVALMQLL